MKTLRIIEQTSTGGEGYVNSIMDLIWAIGANQQVSKTYNRLDFFVPSREKSNGGLRADARISSCDVHTPGFVNVMWDRIVGSLRAL